MNVVLVGLDAYESAGHGMQPPLQLNVHVSRQSSLILLREVLMTDFQSNPEKPAYVVI